MDRILAKLRQGTGRKALLRLALVLFAVRALIPAGTMPSLSALAVGELTWALCVADGAASTTSDPAPDHPGTQASGECPFALCLGTSFLPPQPPLVLLDLPLVWTEPAAYDQNAPPLPARGPPLGSRAPPAVRLG